MALLQVLLVHDSNCHRPGELSSGERILLHVDSSRRPILSVHFSQRDNKFLCIYPPKSTAVMAPTKPKTGGSSKGQTKRSTKPSSSGSSSKIKKKSSAGVLPKSATSERKTKRASHGPEKKKKRVYTDKELGIPSLNAIKPAGIQKPHGMKKGKTFVDDKESMMTILAMVQAEKEGNIESKMMRARQMEEIRAARLAEAEKKEHSRRKKIDDVKDEIRKGKKRSKSVGAVDDASGMGASEEKEKPKKKRVSFG